MASLASPSAKAAKRPEQPPANTPCRACEIGHTTSDGHVLGEGQRRLESVAAMNCCANCCENSFLADARYVISTTPRDTRDANAQFVADALVKKLAKGCARQGGVWRSLDREGFGVGKGYQLLYPHGGRPPAVAIVTECLPAEISLEPRTWKDRTLTSLLAPLDDVYLLHDADLPPQGARETDGAAQSAGEGEESSRRFTRIYTAQQTFCILRNSDKAPASMTGTPISGARKQATSTRVVKSPGGSSYRAVDEKLPIKKQRIA
ncbi:hypothetical protein AB1Y20_003879 [Prymnesium parvum]|uniref:Uncharacterized protein n=1 Tax=Prymnesium parvum TaxID=97485 RepID=A0AB34J544_PRYPA